MRQATLDLLDADLRDGHDGYMSLDDDAHWKSYRQSIVISPGYWKDYGATAAAHPLHWTEVKYSDLATHLDAMTSTDPGLYIFFTQPTQLFHGMPRYPFYVGISGERGSMRPLRDRLRDYLLLSGLKKRKNVHLALQMYYPTVHIVYSFLNIAFTALADTEKALHGYLYPWAGRRDFPVRIKESQKAWGAI